MSKIEAAIPTAGKPDDTKLAAIDADTLARYVVDLRHPWWRRRPCVYALRARIPEQHVEALLERIRDPVDTTEVRIALLDVLGDRPELLPYLQGMLPAERHGVYEQGLEVRGRLGDLTAAVALANLATSPWEREAKLGNAGLDALVARCGGSAVERAIGTETAAGRIFANRLRSSSGDLTPALADPDVGVARRAVELILETGRPDDDHLLDHVVTGPTLDARLWAVYALHRRGRDVRELWAALDRPRVDVPGLPEEIRAAIVRTYAGDTQCDPRWLVERACAEAVEDDSLGHAVAALTAAGLAPSRVQTGADAQGTGDSTYHEVETARGVTLVSTLGRYANAYDGGDQPEVRGVLEAAGFRWIDGELAALVVERLPVYYFGDRDPLDVRTLLFYWQD